MPYIIYDGENYLCQKREGYFIVDNIKQATKWDKITKANVVTSIMPTPKRNTTTHYLGMRVTSAVRVLLCILIALRITITTRTRQGQKFGQIDQLLSLP